MSGGGRAAKQKGKAGERELARVIRELSAQYGMPLNAQRGGWKQVGDQWAKELDGPEAADVHGLPEHHIEVKRQERICIEEWCRQAERDAAAGLVPAVVWRRSRQPWRVTLPLTAYLLLLVRLYAAEAEAA